MDLLTAVVVGLASGAHTSTWGMYKDSPHEGFAWPRYLRSTLLAAAIAVAWQVGMGFDLRSAGSRLVLFGLTYVSERGLVELYKTFIREEDQSKYFIPMQLHVMGRVVQSRSVRWAVAAGWIVLVVAIGWGLLRVRGTSLAPLTVVLLIGSLGGWLSALGGAFKDAPVEGFETLKFFRSPAVALGWALVMARFTDEPVFVVLCALGYTVATIETYKTFFFPHRPRGKFAGKPILFPELLAWRRRFVPLYVSIWLAIVANASLALREAPSGLLGSPSTATTAPVSLQVSRGALGR